MTKRDQVTAMTQPRYCLSQDDLTAVRAYLQRKLATQPFWLDNLQAEGEWDQAKRDPLTLQHWCERWLDEDQWRALKAAVRAARKRRRDRTGPRTPPVNVTLSRRAWLILSELARHEGLTLSEWLIHRHYEEWLKL
jgi:hypothetical protein